MLARKFAVLLAALLSLVAFFAVPQAAQETSDTNTSAGLPLNGIVRTSDGAAVPGSTLRAVQTSSGKSVG